MARSVTGCAPRHLVGTSSCAVRGPILAEDFPQPLMLKKIPTEQVRLGMHIHELCGAWLDHPFWKTKFVLTDPADLVKLRNSTVKECWIDPGKGLDVAEPSPDKARPLMG